MKNKDKKLYTIIFIVMLLLGMLTIYRCPIKYIFGLSCPFCGITRALYCVIKLDFEKAFYYHMLWPLVLLFLIFHILIEYNVIKVKTKIVYVVAYILCGTNLVYYFYRLFNNSAIVNFDFEKSLIKRVIDIIF